MNRADIVFARIRWHDRFRKGSVLWVYDSKPMPGVRGAREEKHRYYLTLSDEHGAMLFKRVPSLKPVPGMDYKYYTRKMSDQLATLIAAWISMHQDGDHTHDTR